MPADFGIILVFQELNSESYPSAYTIMPSPFGLTLEEFEEQFNSIELLGIVYEQREKVDTYRGDCTGDASRWTVQIYLVEITKPKVTAAISLVGSGPPLTAMTITSSRCNASGRKPDYTRFLRNN